jgi:thiol-disulfide isomerase/thioredoxin
MQRLVRFLSFNSYYLLANVIGLILALALLRNGVTALEVAIVVAYAAGAGWLARRLRAPRRPEAGFDGLAAFDRGLRDPRPTMLEFYSDKCALCMAMQPVVRRLEQDTAHRLQILRINVGEPIGLQLANRYGINLTPTYLLLNGAGLKDEAFTLYLDTARVLYWLDQQTISNPLPGITRS